MAAPVFRTRAGHPVERRALSLRQYPFFVGAKLPSTKALQRSRKWFCRAYKKGQKVGCFGNSGSRLWLWRCGGPPRRCCSVTSLNAYFG
jgi:hypothetical protein